MPVVTRSIAKQQYASLPDWAAHELVDTPLPAYVLQESFPVFSPWCDQDSVPRIYAVYRYRATGAIFAVMFTPRAMRTVTSDAAPRIEDFAFFGDNADCLRMLFLHDE